MNKYYFYIFALSVVCIIAAILGKNYPAHFFDEFNVMTIFNSLQIFLLGIYSYKIYLSSQKKQIVWFIFAIIAVYFALDELLQFHEESGLIITFFRSHGVLIPKALNIFGVPLISFGDVIQSLYALVVLYFFYKHKPEIAEDKNSLKLLIIGIIFLTFSETIDFLGIHTSEKYQFLNLSEFQKSLISAVEESFKTVGFGTLLMGFIKRHLKD